MAVTSQKGTGQAVRNDHDGGGNLFQFIAIRKVNSTTLGGRFDQSRPGVVPRDGSVSHCMIEQH